MAWIETSCGPVELRDTGGDGRPVLLLHGVFVDGSLYDAVVDRLAPAHRCLVPTLPLGSHRRPMRPGADLSWAGTARLVVELLDALGLDAPHLVTNDSGGVVGQLLALDHAERVGRWVWTSGEAFANNPPLMFAPFVASARVPGALAATAQALRVPAARRMPTAYGALTQRPIPDATLERWTAPIREPAIRRDLGAHLRTIDKAVTIEAARRLGTVRSPVLLAWGRDDRMFPVADAHRLASVLPDARVEPIADCATYSPLDQPVRLSDLIEEHLS